MPTPFAEPTAPLPTKVATAPLARSTTRTRLLFLSATYRLLPSTPTLKGALKRADSGAAESAKAPVQQAPASVLTLKPGTVTARSTWLLVSATTRPPEGRAISPRGFAKSAAVPTPTALPLALLPASVAVTPQPGAGKNACATALGEGEGLGLLRLPAGEALGGTERVGLGEEPAEAVAVGVALAVADAEKGAAPVMYTLSMRSAEPVALKPVTRQQNESALSAAEGNTVSNPTTGHVELEEMAVLLAAPGAAANEPLGPVVENAHCANFGPLAELPVRRSVVQEMFTNPSVGAQNSTEKEGAPCAKQKPRVKGTGPPA